LQLQKSMNLSREQLVLFQKNAVEICWADKTMKERLKDELDRYHSQTHHN